MLKVILIKTFVTAMGKFDVRIVQNVQDTMGPKIQETEHVYIPFVSILVQAFAAHRSVKRKTYVCIAHKHTSPLRKFPGVLRMSGGNQ